MRYIDQTARLVGEFLPKVFNPHPLLRLVSLNMSLTYVDKKLIKTQHCLFNLGLCQRPGCPPCKGVVLSAPKTMLK